MWKITSTNKYDNPNNRDIHKFNRYYFISNETNSVYSNNGEMWYYDGHIFSRTGNSIKQNETFNYLISLYNSYNDNFIEYIKGNFIVVHCTQNSFSIISDHFAIKKYFYWHNNIDFIVSDDLKEITKQIQPKPSNVNIAIYALTYHFTGGKTLFSDVHHNKPAEIIQFNNNVLNKKYYWQPSELLKIKKKQTNMRSIVNYLDKSIDNSLNLTSGKNVSLSLTGGADTRNLLAIFLKKNIEPHLYTYGNPDSADCQKALSISQKLNLPHSIYNIQMNADIFNDYSRRIIRNSGGLASIHRVHRLISVEWEHKYASYMFLGTLGGEFIKGISQDDYIVPAIVYENWGTNKFDKDSISKYCSNKYLLLNDDSTNEIIEHLLNEPYINNSKLLNKLNSLIYITAHLHDAQDVNLYNAIMEEVFTPFLDIDYLEAIFSTEYSYDNKELFKNNFLRKFENPIFASKFLKEAYKPLLKFSYSGEHKPSDVLFNKYYAGIIKILRKSIAKKYPSNFPLGKWMEEFVSNNLSSCNDYQILKNTFNIDKMLLDLKIDQKTPKESYWLKFTNPIMMKFIIEEFLA